MHAKILQDLRPSIRDMPESGIVELVNAGREKEGLMPLWVGEGHLPTPDFICDAAYEAMKRGETFYTWQRGVPPLRAALADYYNTHFGSASRSFSADNFFVTCGGMQAVQLTIEALLDAGDEIIIPTPGWPNFAAAAEIAGAIVTEVPMQPPSEATNYRWHLDLQSVQRAVTAKTRVLFINSPSNPTGWTATKEELQDILDLARDNDLWIIADEVYHRFYFGDAARAPSFFDVAEDHDKIVFVNTFSKNWSMTGWRMGWICAHPSLGQTFENLVQFSTSGVPTFQQFAGVAALSEGEAFLTSQVETARQSCDVLCNALEPFENIVFARPEGAFYLLFSIKGVNDTRSTALRLIDEALIGLSPGTAFGAGAQKYFRICFARPPEDIQIASDRLTNWLAKNSLIT